ncbi:dermonecrotic toxin domain-containing protein [Pseudomonas akapageensis]|uniref:dermonecrotic toxin domain-containing protein n=1 Tax=Pseudomonas akapageensis TaxID=2609961 RepID=UPI00140B1E1A|nr:DUF6543 domain-containing protein [Pseudomonas akapageensis]
MESDQKSVLSRLDAAVARVLEKQPGYMIVLQRELRERFPLLAAETLLENIYITIQQGVEGRALKSQSFLELFKKCLSDAHIPTYDLGVGGIYVRSDTLDVNYKIPGMDLVALEKFIDDFISGGERAFKRQLQVFWQGAGLASIRSAQLAAEAGLRFQDDTLSGPCHELIKRVIANPTAEAREVLMAADRPGVYAISLYVSALNKTIPLAGVFVLTQKDATGFLDAEGVFIVTPKSTPMIVSHEADAGAVVLYLPGRGLHEFDSLDSLHRELAERLDDDEFSETLFDFVANKDRFQAGAADALHFTQIHRNVFEDRLETQRLKQQDDLRFAWRTAKSQGLGADLAQFEATLDEAIDMHRVLTCSGNLAVRYIRLAGKHLPAWLTDASEENQVRWLTAVNHLHRELALSAAPGLPSVAQYSNRAFMLTYAKQRIEQRLQADLNLLKEPDKIFVTTSSAQYNNSFEPSPGEFSYLSSSEDSSPEYIDHVRSLTELALENVSAIDLDFVQTARIADENNVRIAQLSPSYVKQMIRDLDFGETYLGFLKGVLLTSSQAQQRKDRFAGVLSAQMQVDLISSELAGYFLNDGLSRGICWVQNILARALDSTHSSLVEGQSIEAQQLLIQGATVRDVLVIAPASPSIVGAVVLYMPELPEGRPFREYANRGEMYRHLATDPALRQYIIARVALAEHSNVQRLLERGLRGSEVNLSIISGNLFDELYKAQVRQTLANADAQSTSTVESNRQLVWDATLTLVDIISMILPTKALLPLALGRSLWSLWDGLQAVAREERDEAITHFLEAITHLSDASSDLAVASGFTRSIRRGALLPTKAIDPKFALKKNIEGLKLRSDGIYEEGILVRPPEQGGFQEYFFRDRAERLYQATHDGQTWRVIDARRPDAYYRHPVIRNPLGEWVIHSDVGLKGGARVLSEEAWNNLQVMEVSRQFVGVMSVKYFRIDLAISSQLGFPGSDVERGLPVGTTYRVGPRSPELRLPLEALHTVGRKPDGNILDFTGHSMMVKILGASEKDYVGFAGVKRADGAVRLRWSSRTLNPEHASLISKYHLGNPGVEQRDYVLSRKYQKIVIKQFQRTGYTVLTD